MGPDVQVPTGKSRRLPRDGIDVTTSCVPSAIPRTEAEGTHVLTARYNLTLGHLTFAHQPLVLPNIAEDRTATNSHPHLISIAPDCLLLTEVALSGP